MGKRVLVLAGILVVVAVAWNGFTMWRGLGELKNADIAAVDFDGIADGQYIGSFGKGLVSAKVQVNVADGKVTSIDILEHNNGRGKPAEKIVDSVVTDQSLAVDVISGATYSSKTILKAIEAALQ